MSGTLFLKYKFFNMQQKEFKKIEHAVKSIPDKLFENLSSQAITEIVLEGLKLIPIVLDDEDVTVESQEYKDSDNLYARQFPREIPQFTRGMRYIVSIPFSGDSELLNTQPTKFDVDPPYGELDSLHEGSLEGIVRLENDFLDVRGLSEQAIANEINKHKAKLKKYVEIINDDIESHNQLLFGKIHRFVLKRQRCSNGVKNIAGLIGAKVKEEVLRPSLSKPIKLEIIQPKNKEPKKEGESYIEDTMYEHILYVIRHSGRSFEVTPETFKKMGEENLRDILLSNLNSHFKQTASGESFRKKGKTDICIEANNRAAFVGECKNWGGDQGVVDAISQLLRYLTWRDCKTSLIIFNKTVSGFTQIQEKVPEIMRTHPNFLKEEISEEHGEWRYIFKSEDDEDRHITVHVFLFNLYVKK